jgi:alanine-alpha-ketoisovalerate/valine-pyruvate aminotransferase
MKTIKTFYKPENIKKFRITRILLYKYLRDWKTKVKKEELNYFYWESCEQLKILNNILYSNKRGGSFRFYQHEISFLKNIRDAKNIVYGKYTYKF